MFNSTDNMTAMPADDALPYWVIIFDRVQLVPAIIGIFSNLATLITLSVNGEDFSNIIRMLFQYQSALDGLCCLQACLLFSLPPMWSVGNKIFDTIVCQVWHSHTIYWVNIIASIWNLVTLAIERYLCICHPLRYINLTRAHFRVIIVSMFISVVIFMSVGPFQTRMREGRCRGEYYWDTPGTVTLFYVFGIMSFFIDYAIPAILFIILYGLVIFSFHKRGKKNLGASGSAGVIDKATTELTKTAIVVTLIFLVAIGMDLWYYVLGYAGVTEYIYNSPLQKLGVLFAVLNSVVNPFVYASFMPLYRKSVKKTFFKSCSGGN